MSEGAVSVGMHGFGRIAAVGVLAALWLCVLGGAASADLADFCPKGSGAGQCDAPDAIAVNEASGAVYIADTGNLRVVVFEADGSFVRAFGWDVIPSGNPGDTGTGLEACTAASGCKKGAAGGGPGQLAGNGPDAIAVDNTAGPSQGMVYLVDTDNFRVQKLTPTGEFVWMIGGGVNKGGGTPSTPGNICTAEHLANGDSCGAGKNGKGTEEFFSDFNGLNRIFVAIDPRGNVYVADSPAKGSNETAGYDNRVQVFDEDGAFIRELVLAELTTKEVKAFAVDRGSGDCYVNERGGDVHRYLECDDALAAQTFPGLRADALATNGSGDLFVEEMGFNAEIHQYDSAAKPVRTFYGNGTLEAGAISLAPYSGPGGDIFAIEASSPRRLSHIAFPPPGPVIVPGAATKAQPVGSIRATFKTRVNPEGKETDVHFEYVDDATYEADIAVAEGEGKTKAQAEEEGRGFDSAKRAPEEAAKDPVVAPDTVKWVAHEVAVQIACSDPDLELPEGKCLEAETEYHLRAVASNADSEPEERFGPEATFETRPPIELGALWATGVGEAGAELNAEVDPIGVPTKARFQYVSEEQFEAEGFAGASESEEIDFGEAEEGFVAAGTAIGGLQPATTYRYRYVATSFFGDFESSSRSFTTLGEGLPPRIDCPNQALRTGAAATLPDCRAYELVSPLDKGAADVVSTASRTSQGVPAEQSDPSGSALAYTSFRSFGDSVSSPITSQYLARRGSAGWATNSLNPPLSGGNLYESVFGRPIFKGFSEDLCQGWLVQNTEAALTPGAPEQVPNLYRRSICDGAYELLTAVAPPGFTREGEEGTVESEGDTGTKYYPGIGGWSADGSLTAFKAAAALTEEAHLVGAGKVLGCELGTNSAGGAGPPTYQWLRDGVPIAGTVEQVKSAKYTTKNADKGHAVQCRMTATNEEADESGAKLGAVAFTNPAPVISPAPEGLAPIAPPYIPPPSSEAPLQVGDPGGTELECEGREADWQGAPSAFAYQWYRNGAPISGATAPTHTASAEELEAAATFQCAITATNAGGKVSIASANLTTTGPAPDPPAPHPRAFTLDIYRVYAKQGEDLALVSVAPSGEAVHTHAAVGTRHGASDTNSADSVVGAVSDNGQRIFFSATTKSPPQSVHQEQAPLVPVDGESRLYLRVNPMAPQSVVEEPSAEQFRCTEPAKACTVAIGAGVARFIAADPEAGTALYLEAGKLYELDVEAAIAYEPEAATEVASGVRGVLGASKDVSRAYLVSDAICSSQPNSEGQSPQAGKPNLYLYESGQSCGAQDMAFVGTLGERDVVGGDNLSVLAPEPFQRRSRVSPDGLHAAFVSRAPLTGYDNTDAQGGEPAAEVFIYDATESQLRCASCNPSGGRPRGENVRTAAEPVWVAAQIPGWATQWHPSRALAGDGSRLFFESYEALVARDGNGRLDVYEWQQAASRQDCEEAGAERYAPGSEGCLSLISSGTSAGGSEFLDASASGSDVFFRTASSLVAEDYGLIDIYDARAGGGFPPPEEETGSECEGEACQSPPPAPEQSTPSSASFQGAGDAVRDPCAAPVRKARRLAVRAKRLRRIARRAGGRHARVAHRKAGRSARQARRQAAKTRLCRRRAREEGR